MEIKTTLQFVDELKRRYGIGSDYGIAKLLNISKNSLSLYRNGKSHFSDEVAIKVAELLDLDAGYVMACMAYERARSPLVKSKWEKAATSLYGLAVALAIVVIVPLTHLSNSAFAQGLGGDTSDSTVYYVKCLLVVLSVLFALVARLLDYRIHRA